MIAPAPGNVRDELAPGGVLRVGVNLGNFLLVKKQPDDSLKGIVPDLAQDLASHLGATVKYILHAGAGEVADGGAKGTWDVAFIGAEPARAAQIAFTDAYLEIPASYLVPAGSPLQSIGDVDRPGVRIATSARSAYDLFLSRSLRHAELVRAEGIPASYDLFVAQKLDALSGLLPRLVAERDRTPGSRILEGQFTAVQQAIGTPRAREASAAWLRDYCIGLRRDGRVAAAIARHGIQGVNVAPL